jgi:hypothetical protein
MPCLSLKEYSREKAQKVQIVQKVRKQVIVKGQSRLEYYEVS